MKDFVYYLIGMEWNIGGGGGGGEHSISSENYL